MSRTDAGSGTADAEGFSSFLHDIAAAPAIQPKLPKLVVGMVIAERYRVESELGAGGMGVVFRATDLRLGRQVALKMHTRTERDASLELLRVEARALAHLTHPNVVEVFEVGTHEERLFIAMEFVDGGSLDEWEVDRPWREIVGVYIEAGEGLAAAHRAGLVHRDFKPANVLIGRDGRPRVADFGLVLDLSAQHTDSVSDSRPGPAVDLVDSDNTPMAGLSARARVGTPRYMAPEQAAGGGADHRSDQYALCSALFEALTGDVPMDDVVELPTRPGVPAEVWQAILEGLATDPKLRHENITDLLEALRRAMHPRRHVAGPAVVVAAVLGSMGAGAFYAGSAATPQVQCQRDARATVSSWDGDRARMQSALRERGDAVRADAFAQQLDDYASEWLSTREDVCAAARNDRRRDAAMRCLGRGARALESILAVVTAAPPDPAEPHRTLPLPPLHRCSLDRAATPRQPPADPSKASAVEGVFADIDRAHALIWNGDPEAARAPARAALREANQIQHPPTLVAALLSAGDAELEAGRLESSHGYYEQGFYLAQSLGLDEDAAQAGGSLIEILQDLGDLRAADRWVKHAMSSFERLEDDADPAGEVSLLSSIGNLRSEQGRYDEALEIQRRILSMLPKDGDEVRRSKAHNSLGATLYNMGNPAAAIEHFELSLALNDVARGADHPDNVYPLANLAWILIEAEELDRAEPLLDRAIRLLKDKTADDSYALATLLSHRGALHDGRGEHAAALRDYAEGLALVASELGEEHALAGMLLNNQASSFEAIGEYGPARVAYEDAIRVLERLGDPQDEVLSLARTNLAQLAEASSSEL